MMSSISRRTLAALGAGLWLATAGLAVPAQAQAPAAAPAPAPDYAALDAREAADQAIVDQVFAAVGKDGLRAIEAFKPALIEMLDRAPAVYPQVEARTGGLTVVRANDPTESLGLMLVVTAAAARNNEQVRVVTRPNTYMLAAMLLGSWAVERRRADEAIAWLDRGLRLQPDQPYLTSEKAAAMALKRQFAAVPAMCDAALKANPFMAKGFRAKLLRAKGFALIELGRLDDAEAAYRESLTFEPDSPVAARELDYIRGQRRGEPATEPELVVPDADSPPEPEPEPSTKDI